jgi:uncharacterized LabA/DUF88 family protein
MKDEIQARSGRLAVLIDADNANADLIESLLKEIAKYGVAHVKRIYGDWTTTQLHKWKDRLNKYAIQPIQQFRYTVGKNATDSALIIDAMDLLYTQNFDGFCIVSSDSDFTRLASRIRESGLVVYGFGEKKTPESFVNACDKFIFTEILEHGDLGSLTNGNRPGEKTALLEATPSKTVEIPKDQKLRNNKKLLTMLKDAYEAIAEEDEWVNLGHFGSQLTKLSSSFDPRNYDYKQLSDLVRDTNIFELKKTEKAIYIRLKP